MNKIKNAIILNGPGRSGTTLVSQMLAYHEELAWISSWNNKYPNNYILSFFSRLYNSKFLGLNWHKLKIVPKPAEAYGFWTFYFKGFNSLDKDMVEVKNEISQSSEKCKKAINHIIRYNGKRRFITKLTGSPRLDYLDAIFDNYQVVWIERDPRVVVSSYIKQKWFYKDKPEEFNALTELEKIEFYCNYYKRLRKESSSYNNVILFKYEDLIENTDSAIRNLCKELGISYSKNFNRIINKWSIKPVTWENYKTKYSKEGIELFNVLLEKELKFLGYK